MQSMFVLISHKIVIFPPQGSPGNVGDRGFAGPRGERGQDGEPGSTGRVGPLGPQVNTGLQSAGDIVVIWLLWYL